MTAGQPACDGASPGISRARRECDVERLPMEFAAQDEPDLATDANGALQGEPVAKDATLPPSTDRGTLPSNAHRSCSASRRAMKSTSRTEFARARSPVRHGLTTTTSLPSTRTPIARSRRNGRWRGVPNPYIRNPSGERGEQVAVGGVPDEAVRPSPGLGYSAPSSHRMRTLGRCPVVLGFVSTAMSPNDSARAGERDGVTG